MAPVCKACQQPLILQISTNEDDDAGIGNITTSVPDDLELGCGCHFHWQCLLDQASAVAISLTCPSCNAYLPTNPTGPSATNVLHGGPAAAGTGAGQPEPAIPVRYASEGGVQDGLDMYPVLTEEYYLTQYPEARPARALHVMAAEGDVVGIVDLLRDADAEKEEEEEEKEGRDNVGVPAMDASHLLQWMDPLNGSRTALHVAIERRQEEVIWLLRWLGSRLRTELFPEAAVQAARNLGLDQRRQVEREEDVRFIGDGSGRTPGSLLAQLGEPWRSFVESHRFTT